MRPVGRKCGPRGIGHGGRNSDGTERGERARGADEVPLRPRDRRVPVERQAHGLLGASRSGDHHAVLHVLHPDRGHPADPRVVPHVVFVLRVDRGHLEPARRLRLVAGVQDGQARAIQRRHLRLVDHRALGRLRCAGVQHAVGVPLRHLSARCGRRCDPGGHSGPCAGLQPAARPGLGHGFLDRRSCGWQPDHLDRGRPHARPLPEDGRDRRMEEPVRHLRCHHARRVLPRPVLHEGPVVAPA